jgi:hypothetical protein
MKILGAVSDNGQNQATGAMVLRLYLRQRFLIVKFGALAAYLLLFSKNDLSFAASDAISLATIFLFLLAMRIYDDLQNAHHDAHKLNRIYTDPAAAKPLYGACAIVALLVAARLSFVSLASGATFISFIVVNHVIYLVFINRFGWRSFLPFLKYPFIVALIGNNWSAGSLALFFAFLTFDLIDDPTFPLPHWSSVITSLAAFALLIPSTSPSCYVIVGGLAIAASLVSLARSWYAAYAFLILILLARLIEPLYEF